MTRSRRLCERSATSRPSSRAARALSPLAARRRQPPVGDVPVVARGGAAAGLEQRLRRPVGVLRRRRRRGVRLRRLGLSLACSSPAARTRPSSTSTSRRRGGPLKFEEKPLDIGADPKLLDQRHRRLSDRHRRRRPHGPVRPARRPEPDAEGRPGLHVHARQQGMGLRRRSRLDDLVRRRMGEGPEIPDPRHRPLRRPRRAGLALGHVPGQFAVPSAAGRQARLFGAHAARARLLRALDAVHRLEQVGRRRRSRSPTTGNIIAAARSRSGGSSRASRPGSTRRADGWRHVSIFGMGIAEGDIDGSGYPQYA